MAIFKVEKYVNKCRIVASLGYVTHKGLYFFVFYFAAG